MNLLALGCVVLGLVSGAAVAAASRTPRTGLRVALDFWLAAGLLRLSRDAEWTRILAAVGIVLIRQVAGRGLKAAAGSRTR